MESIKQSWVILVIAAAVLATVFFIGGKISAAPSDQFQPSNSVTVVPIQTSRDSYGLAMVDMKNETIWVYELTGRGITYNKLKLIAARSWRYDRQLENFNSADPKPEQVKNFINQALRGNVPAAMDINEANSVAEPNQK